ncbi:MAG TPA: hypothetical protein DIW31_10740 [Bacteroidales bacterium]|nr:hypothetical protein [Bacteroidales bacterium]
MKRSLLLASILILFLIVSCLKDDSEPTQVLRTNNPLVTDLDKSINKIVAPYAKIYTTAGVSIGIFKNNQTSFYGYGETKKGNEVIPDSETMYEIGSITKTFTALLTVDYLLTNSLTLETPINSFLPLAIPPLQYNGNSIMVKHLLNHTSGLPRLPEDFQEGMNPNNPYKHYDSLKVYNYLKNYVLSANPGQKWEYSNLGVGLAGLILERKNHKSYEQLLLEKICTPLGLSKTKITLNSIDSSNFAVGYTSFGTQVPYWDDMNAYKGAGAIRSNANDMINYGKAILNSDSSPLKTQIETCLNVTYEDINVKMASGWIKQNINGNDVFLHDGGTGGFSSFIIICKPKNVILVLLFNNEASYNTGSIINPLIAEVLK